MFSLPHRSPRDLPFVTDHTALLLVDMQVDFAEPDGAMGKSGMDLSMVGPALRNAVLLADAARAQGLGVEVALW